MIDKLDIFRPGYQETMRLPLACLRTGYWGDNVTKAYVYNPRTGSCMQELDIYYTIEQIVEELYDDNFIKYYDGDGPAYLNSNLGKADHRLAADLHRKLEVIQKQSDDKQYSGENLDVLDL
jgi:hypothetical protein